jgi:hypothetical protein
MKQFQRKRWWVLALLVVLCLLLAWLFWPDRQLARAQQLQKELSDQTENRLTGEERRQKWREFREARNKLSSQQRRKLGDDRRKRRNEAMSRYARMSKEEKNRYIDEQIQRMEQRRQAGGLGQGGREGNRGGGNQDGNGESSGPPSSGSRDARRQQWLDDSTPTERAQIAEYFHDLFLRRQQFGMGGGRMR